MDGLNTPKFTTNESSKDVGRRNEIISAGKEHQNAVSRQNNQGKLNRTRFTAYDVTIRTMHTKS
jgi:hypothetical protein